MEALIETAIFFRRKASWNYEASDLEPTEVLVLQIAETKDRRKASVEMVSIFTSKNKSPYLLQEAGTIVVSLVRQVLLTSLW